MTKPQLDQFATAHIHGLYNLLAPTEVSNSCMLNKFTWLTGTYFGIASLTRSCRLQSVTFSDTEASEACIRFLDVI